MLARSSARRTLLLVLLLALAVPRAADAAHGVAVLFPQDSTLGTALALDGSGRILVGGDTGAGSGFGVVRLSKDGKVDRHFGSHGIAKFAIGKSDFDDLTSVLVLHDGAILASGTVGTDNSQNGGAGNLFGVARLTPQGRLDTRFGEHGTRRFTLQTGQDNAMWSAAMPDGNILFGGDSDNNGTIFACQASLGADLQPNHTFTPQCVLPADTAGSAYFGAAAPDAGGTEVVSLGGDAPGGHAALAPPAFGIGRFLPSGATDTSFGDQGFTVTSFGVGLHDGALTGKRPLAARPGGWIVGGTTAHKFGFVGFTATGAIDPAFGSGGKLEVDADGTSNRDVLMDLVASGKGQYLAVGQSEKGSRQTGTSLLLARIDASGKLVRSFGHNGRLRLTAADLGVPFLGQIDDALVEPDGSILVTGAARVPYGGRPVYAMLVLRLKPNGRLDRGFG